MEAFMSPTVTILMLIGAWLAVAGAMLWGVLRISRRHHPMPRPQAKRQAPRQQVAHSH
jgi:hypothetical protein